MVCHKLSGLLVKVPIFRIQTRLVESFSRNRIAEIDLADFSLERIRNFSIVAHIDHGKSTLADRLLEHVGAIKSSSGNKQVLDKLRVERERGITVKAQTASVIFKHPDTEVEYLINMIDTPGHVDFASEVSRSLKGCQGVILLVDANQGVQAQTVSNFFMAFANDLVVVPVLNKIDLPRADIEGSKDQMENLFEIDREEVLCASAKQGIGIEDILKAVVKRIPPPNRHGAPNLDLRLLLQDSWYDKFFGTVNLVQVFDGRLKVGDQIMSNKSGISYVVKTLNLLVPDELPVKELFPGQVGVMTCNMRSTSEAVIGDTYFKKGCPGTPLIVIEKPRPMVYAGFYPFNPVEQDKLKGAIEKVSLNDYGVTVEGESSTALGFGWRLGFLGLLHMEVFSQRLEDEYEAEVIITTPSVPYKLTIKPEGKKYGPEILIRSPSMWPPSNLIEKYYEPIVKATIITPSIYLGPVLGLITDFRGFNPDTQSIDQNRVKIDVVLPLSEIVVDFFDTLKSLTSGYGSFDYEDAGFQESELSKVDILLNDQPVPELSFISHTTVARAKGKEVVGKLKENLPRQQFSIKIQAAVNSTIIAREDVKAYRKDVTSKCYGGDLTRKMKLINKQIEGKKKLRSMGKIEVEKDTFVKILRKK